MSELHSDIAALVHIYGNLSCADSRFRVGSALQDISWPHIRELAPMLVALQRAGNNRERFGGWNRWWEMHT